MTRPEDLLSDALRERIEHFEAPSTPLSDVVSTARHLRRRRNLRAGVATAAAALVLAAPFVVNASRSSDTGNGPAGPSQESTAPVTLADVALGAPPTIAWIDGRDYVAADGTRTRLPFDDVVRVVPYRDSLLVVRRGDGHVIWLGHEDEAQWCGHGSLALSPDGASTAFAVSPATADCTRGGGEITLHVGPTGPSSTADRTRPMPLRDAGLVGILGDAVVASPYNEGQPVLLGLDGTTTTLDPLARVTGVNARLGLVSGRLAGSQDAPPTGAVLDPTTGSVSWTSPGWLLQDFSPDGSSVVGLRPGAPDAPLTWGVFDAASGSQLHEFTTPAGFAFWTAVWEDDQHLLLDTTQGDAQALVRVALDGTLQLATEPSPIDADSPAGRYALAPNAFP
ncbi:hypothetical protein [Nocardioides psychrotolerans]|uniref:hypothetical protein n=1 Tax=Nocardioides psychrotolerans TaxID=1005945 RepID=UPI00313820A4